MKFREKINGNFNFMEMIKVEKRDKNISNAKRDDLKVIVFKNRTLTFENCKINETSIEFCGDNSTINFKNCELENVIVLAGTNLRFDGCKIKSIYYQETVGEATLEVKNSEMNDFYMLTSEIETCHITDTKLNKFVLQYSLINEIIIVESGRVLNTTFESNKLFIQ